MNGEKLVEELKQICHDKELNLIHRGNGHYQITDGGKRMVNYYPFSKRQTAYLNGTSCGLTGVKPKEAVEIMLRGSYGC